MKVTENRWQVNAGLAMYQAAMANQPASDKSDPDKTGNLPNTEGTAAVSGETAGKTDISTEGTAEIGTKEKAESSEKEKKELTPKEKEELEEKQELEALKRLSENLSAQKNSKNKNGFGMKSSSPEESVGQLAALLARSETRFDVLQVSGKAMRALANLKMSVANADKETAKKITQKIRRLEKLMKQIQKKLRNLSKEEQLERQRQRAIKRQEEQKAKEIQNELQSRRKKRRKEERNYAFKELSKDQKEENGDMLSDAMGSDGMTSPDLSSMIETGGADLSSVSFEGVSIDIMV